VVLKYGRLLLALATLVGSSANAQQGSAAQCVVGRWQVQLSLDSAVIDSSAPDTPRTIPGHPAAGTIEFRSEHADSLTPTESDSTARASWGTFAIDFNPLWGQHLIPQPSTSWREGNPSPLVEAVAVEEEGQVLIVLMPRISHGAIGLLLDGCSSPDQVLEGRWVVLNSRSQAIGRYSLRRER
jgi:hypothetical protein